MRAKYSTGLYSQGKFVCNILAVKWKIVRQMAPLYRMGKVPPPKQPKKPIAGSIEYDGSYPETDLLLEVDEIRLTCKNEGRNSEISLLGVELLSDPHTFLAKEITVWRICSENKCECGSDVCGSPQHSSWCPKYKNNGYG